jgi:hypothetical protein
MLLPTLVGTGAISLGAATAVRPLPQASAASSARPLAPGMYVVRRFFVPLELRVGSGWRLARNAPDSVALLRNGFIFSVLSPRHVYDPRSPDSQPVRPAPANMLAWFLNHFRLRITSVRRERLGGVAALHIRFLVPGARGLYYPGFSGRSVKLFVDSRGGVITAQAGQPGEVFLARVHGRTVLVLPTPPGRATRLVLSSIAFGRG